LKRYLKLKPTDAYAASQLAQLLGQEQSAAALGPRTRELVAGIRTGGFKASQRAPAPEPGGPEPTSDLRPAEDGLLASLGALVRRALPATLLITVVVLAVRFLLRTTDELSTQTMATSDQLRQNIVTVEPAAPPPPAVDYDRLFATALDEATRLDQSGEHERAIAAYEKVMEDFPKRPRTEQAAFRRASLLMVVGRNGAAQEAFTSFLARYPASTNAAEALLRRGQAAARNLDDAAAEADFSRFLEQNSGSPLVAEAWVSRGELSLRGKKADAAKADFEAALARLGPGQLRDRALAGLEQARHP
jgi:outer membrane protein assembly factor BamD (BamD/ComL family)